jgi:hypothetical protein
MLNEYETNIVRANRASENSSDLRLDGNPHSNSKIKKTIPILVNNRKVLVNCSKTN